MASAIASRLEFNPFCSNCRFIFRPLKNSFRWACVVPHFDQGIAAHDVILNVSSDPPNGIGDESIAPFRVKLLNRRHQADVPLLNQIEKFHAVATILVGNPDNKAEIRKDESLSVVGVAAFDIGSSCFCLLLSAE